MPTLSKRLSEVVDALPLGSGMRVLEIGCGPGAMARAIAERIGNGQVLGIDRSAKAVAQAKAGGSLPNLAFHQSSVETVRLKEGEPPYDIAVAIRVGALDGRHPESEKAAIADALVPNGRLFIDGGDPLHELSLIKTRRSGDAGR